MIDGHVHLENGDLSVDYAMQFVDAAVKKGIRTLQILDHTHRFLEFAPMYAGVRSASTLQADWLKKKTKDHLSTYHHLIETMKQMDLPIEVRFGLEVCYTPEAEPFLRDILSQYPYDFLVGSVHSVDGILYDMPFSRELLWDRYPADNIYRRYYELIEQLMRSGLFTQVAHPDTIKLFDIYPSYDLVPTYEKLARSLRTSKPRVLVDLAVPIDIEEKTEWLPGIRRYDIDDFRELAKTNNEKKMHEAVEADHILEGMEELTGSRVHLIGGILNGV